MVSSSTVWMRVVGGLGGASMVWSTMTFLGACMDLLRSLSLASVAVISWGVVVVTANSRNTRRSAGWEGSLISR